MAFQLEDDGSSQQGGSLKIANGVFAQRLKIEEIEDKSSYPGETPHYFKSGKETELYLVLKCKKDDGKEKQLHLMGHFKKDQVTGKVTGWDGFNNGVQQFLVRVDKSSATVEDNFSLSASTLAKYVGKELISVRYVSGTYQNNEGNEAPSFSDWRVFGPDTTTEQIQAEWSQSAQYLKSYKPEIWTAWESTRPQAGAAQTQGQAAPPVTNDDLPF